MNDEEFFMVVRRLSNQCWVRYFLYWKENYYVISLMNHDGQETYCNELDKYGKTYISGLMCYEIPREAKERK